MRLSIILYDLILARTVIAYLSLERRPHTIIYGKGTILETRNVDDELIESLLPRTSSDKAPGPSKSPSPRQNGTPSDRGSQPRPVSPLNSLESNLKSRQRAGDTSVNSSPVRKRPSAAADSNAFESRKRPGPASQSESLGNRQRFDLTHRGGNPVLTAGVAQQNIGIGQVGLIINRSGPTQRAVRDFIERWHPRSDNKGGSLQAPGPSQNSPDTLMKLQAVRHQLQMESDRMWRVSSPNPPYLFPARQAENAMAIPERPHHADSNRLIDRMTGSALRIAGAQPRNRANGRQGQEGVGGIAQGIGRAPVAPAVVAHQQQHPQNRGVQPDQPNHLSTSSTQNHYESSSEDSP